FAEIPPVPHDLSKFPIAFGALMENKESLFSMGALSALHQRLFRLQKYLSEIDFIIVAPMAMVPKSTGECASTKSLISLDKMDVTPNDHLQRSIPSQRSASTAVQLKSYYNYGGTVSPTFYPTFDSLSVLASLAFFAFVF
ncbi:hypothetical protein PV325_010526, partial [Microctonus aethiopoides]